MPHKEYYYQQAEEAQYEFLNGLIADMSGSLLFPLIELHGLEPLMNQPVLKVQKKREKYCKDLEDKLLPF